jgi:hypothetical protein
VSSDDYSPAEIKRGFAEMRNDIADLSRKLEAGLLALTRTLQESYLTRDVYIADEKTRAAVTEALEKKTETIRAELAQKADGINTNLTDKVTDLGKLYLDVQGDLTRARRDMVSKKTVTWIVATFIGFAGAAASWVAVIVDRLPKR